MKILSLTLCMIAYLLLRRRDATYNYTLSLIKKKMNEITDIVKGRFEEASNSVQTNLITMLNRYHKSNWSNLPEMEQQTNRLDIYRSIGDYNCGYVCTHVNSDEFEQINGEYYSQNDIFNGWDAINSEIENYESKILQNEEEFWFEVEQIYIEWFVRNWEIAKTKVLINNSIQYCLSENNSQRCFDLNLLNWDNYIDNGNYLKYQRLINKLDEIKPNLKKRILVDMLGNEIESMERIFHNDGHMITFEAKSWSLKVSDNKGEILFNSDFKNNNQPYVSKFEATKFMLRTIDELIIKGYEEK